MARPKKAGDKKPGGMKTVAVRATVEWADYVERGAEHCRTDVAKLFDAAVIEYLRARGFTETPPKRTP